MSDDPIRDHTDLVYATCLRILGNDQDAADASQEVFIAWLRSRNTIRGSVAAWLHATATGRSLDLLRRRHRRNRHEDAAARLPRPESADLHLAAQIDAALAELDHDSRALLIEHHVLGRTQQELAARFCRNQATISRRMTAAAERLKRLLQQRGITAGAATACSILAAPNPCPAALVAPVLAQAQIAGPIALLGPAVIGKSLATVAVTWLAIASAAALLVVSVAAVAIWQSLTPAIPASLQGLFPTGSIEGDVPDPRYPSIEAVLAELPATDPDRQAAWDALIQVPFPEAKAEDPLILRELPIGTVPADLAMVLPQLDELDALLMRGPVHWGIVGSLSSAYLAGKLGPMTRWASLSETKPDTLAERMMREQFWIRRMVRLHSALLWLAPTDTLLAQGERIDTLIDAAQSLLVERLVQLSLVAVRENIMSRLEVAGRLPEPYRSRWLARSFDFSSAQALRHEIGLFHLPMIEDLIAGRPCAATDGTILSGVDWWFHPNAWRTRLHARMLMGMGVAYGDLLAGRPVDRSNQLVHGPLLILHSAQRQRLACFGRRLAARLRDAQSLPADSDGLRLLARTLPDAGLIIPGPESPGYRMTTRDDAVVLELDVESPTAAGLEPDFRNDLRLKLAKPTAAQDGVVCWPIRDASAHQLDADRRAAP